MLEVLNDDAWDIWHVSQVTSGLNGAQCALLGLCQGSYQVPRSARCDHAFVRDPNAAGLLPWLTPSFSMTKMLFPCLQILFWIEDSVCLAILPLRARIILACELYLVVGTANRPTQVDCRPG